MRFITIRIVLLMVIVGFFSTWVRPTILTSSFSYTTCSASNPCDVVHLTKEFGNAIYGGLGVMITGLTTSQTQVMSQRVAVILPYFSFFMLEEFTQEVATNAFIVYSTHYQGIITYLIAAPQCENFQFPYRWGDAAEMCFESAAAQFIISRSSSFSVIHGHGATSAMILNMVHQQAHPRPAMVYTVHDYAIEVLWQLDPNIVPSTMAMRATWKPHMLAMMLCDAITLPSTSILDDIITAGPTNPSRSYPPIFSSNVLWRLRDGGVFAVPNGLSTPNPFSGKTSYSGTKAWAGAELCRIAFFSRLQLYQPSLIFIGHGDVVKGVGVLNHMGHLCMELELTCIIITRSLYLQADTHTTGWLVASDPHIQALVRLHADLIFVPSLREMFGYVALEALLHGSWVITSGVGGLRDFLIPCCSEKYNSYFFDVFSHDTHPPMLRSLLIQARADVQRLKGSYDEYELALNRLVQTALTYRWGNGPVQGYAAVYAHAVQFKNNKCS
eukprot:NODE_252_length_2091_cov_91.196866_g170_i0.p1 GENE.NODE_252_length_2091_cov_91.196866_g170_i0~~NODE_252_length_2091_cov_91.196866_g170_i0.p1  ORF type:complete len:517 (+),score=115.93 NODE_252_length_2091_cov_91.196866_g170_i0:59-1552(+)